MYQTQSALVRAYFAAFTEGVLFDTAAAAGVSVASLTPKQFKEKMVAHFEDISANYFDILFNPLALLHYDSAEELIAVLQSPEVAPTLKSQVDLLRHVCRTNEAHDAMVEEYKRCITCILSGNLPTVEDFFSNLADNHWHNGTAPTVRDVRSITQVTVKAFLAGRRVGGDTAAGNNQATLFRLLIDAMQTLLHQQPVAIISGTDLNKVFLTVCRSQQNMQTMLQAYNECLHSPSH